MRLSESVISKQKLHRLLTSRSFRGPAADRFVAVLILVLVLWAEVMTTYVAPRDGLIAHSLLLTLFLAAYTLEPDARRQAFFLAATIAALIRIVSLSMPVRDVPQPFWYALTAIPLLVAGAGIIRLLDLAPSSIGLCLPRGRWAPLEVAVAASGLALGYLEWRILHPMSIVPRSPVLWIVAGSIVLLLCTGFTEELLFRGIVQRVAGDLLGAASGIVFTSLLFAALHAGWHSITEMCFAAGVGLYFGIVRRYTQSLWGVAVAHGLTNIVLFIWLPLSLLPSAVQIALAAENPIQIENAQPGTTNWTIVPSRADHLIEGYTNLTSVDRRQTITFFVNDVPASSYTIDIFRMGWYRGTGARLMQTVPRLQGQPQPACPPDPTTGLIACRWSRSYTLTVPSTWTSGVYLARLTRSDGYGQYIIFDVRDDASRSMYLFQNSVTTYEAYNNWGGKSLYGGVGAHARDLAYRAYQVSFDRPYMSTTSGDVARGPYDFFRYEYPMVRWMERMGYDVSYATDVDTDESAGLLRQHQVFLSVGHDEYWSRGMRAHVTAARASGVNLAFFDGNSMYWQIRFGRSPLGRDRVITCYKSAALDPLSHTDPALTTVQWRQPPVNRPENEIMGEMYGGNTALDEQGSPTSYPFVVSNSSNWVYDGTGLKNGSVLPGRVGPEYDRVWNNGHTPQGVVVLSTSPVMRESFQNGKMDTRADVAEATIYRAHSGATVFDAGTIDWVQGLDGYVWTVRGTTGGQRRPDPAVQAITANVLSRTGR